MRRVLMIAYHFPPIAGGSGVQRTLRFVQQLPQFGWAPIVLTVDPRAHEHTADDLVDEIPSGVPVERAFAFDVARLLPGRGRYPRFLARPDRWWSWRFSGVSAGMRLIRSWAPAAIWSTYPIPTAHVIAHALFQRTHLPWIADFRDPMAQEDYPADPGLWSSFRRIEARTIRDSSMAIFTSPGAARMYRIRYPDAASRMVVIENGFDEGAFRGLSASCRHATLTPGAFTLLHSGIVYPSERDPTALFEAVDRMARAGHLARGKFKLRFRAPADAGLLAKLVSRHSLSEIVELLPPIPYRDALDEMVRADGLLLLQAANCNEQIPAKFYEYLRAGQPIVALTDTRGDTAAAMRDAGLDAIAPLDNAGAIERTLRRFLRLVDERRARNASPEYVAAATRLERTRALADLLERTCAHAAEFPARWSSRRSRDAHDGRSA